MSTAYTTSAYEIIQAYYCTVRKDCFIIFHYSNTFELALLA